MDPVYIQKLLCCSLRLCCLGDGGVLECCRVFQKSDLQRLLLPDGPSTMPTLRRTQSTVEASLTERNVRRFLSFQRYMRSSNFFRGVSNQNLLYMLDEDYDGQAKCMLTKVGNWNFDIFLFERLTNGNSLVTLTWHLFNKCKLIEEFRLDIVKLRRFLVLVQEDYHSQNPYHNGVHAADVTQAMYCYLNEPKIIPTVRPWDILVSLIAACTHDLDHPGFNQPYLIKTKHHLASLYKNTSVLENHHWRSAVGLIRETGLISHLPTEDRQLMENQIGSLILATDITRQAEYLSSFTAHMDLRRLCLFNPCHLHFVLQMAIKCADISNPCRPWDLYLQWSEKVTEEFFNQGDLEKKRKLEVSPLCDRLTQNKADIQIGFISFLVEPLFTQWNRFSNSRLSRTMLDELTLNKGHWQQIRKEQTSNGGKTSTAQEKKD